MSSHKGKEKKFIHKPYYPGGKDALRSFIRAQKRYPAQAAQNQIKGVVRIKMTIDLKGNIIRTKLIKKLGYGCDEEAIRVVEMLKYKVPHTRKLKGTFNKNINIHFGPRAKVNTSKSTPYKYTISKKEESKSSSKSTSYHYTINWSNEKK